MKDNRWKLHGRPLNGEKCSPNDKHNSGRVFMSEFARTSQPLTPAGNQGDFGTSSFGGIAQSSNS